MFCVHIQTLEESLVICYFEFPILTHLRKFSFE